MSKQLYKSAQTDLVVVQMDKALLLLADADATQAKQVHDLAAAAETYAKRQKLGDEAIGYAHSIKIEALRRIGDQLAAAPKNPGTRLAGTDALGGTKTAPPSDVPTLADIGIDKKTSAVAQKLADLPAEQFEQVRLGAITVSKACAAVVKAKNDELKNAAPPSPAGRYDCIVIDPPWEMQKIERDVRPNQVAFEYPTMTEDDLAAFDVAGMSAEDAHLFCWTTHKHLPSALRLLEAWDYRYVLTMVWHKPGGFQPIGLPQYNCEFALYARRGTPKFIDTKAFNCCFNAPRREHSRKPDEFYDVIRRVTGGKRIDVFSRESRDGFDSFGNEAGKFDEAAA